MVGYPLTKISTRAQHFTTATRGVNEVKNEQISFLFINLPKVSDLDVVLLFYRLKHEDLACIKLKCWSRNFSLQALNQNTF